MGLLSKIMFPSICAALILMCSSAASAVKAASSDGEATVYLSGPFSSDFDIAFLAVLRPGGHNKSWSMVSVLLIGSAVPGPGVSVGLASASAHNRSIHPFTYVVYPSAKDSYEEHHAYCGHGCTIELRGDDTTVYAYVEGHLVSSWSRSDLYLQHPNIQLNGEVHGVGDSIFASLTPIRLRVGRHQILHQPSCAFSTRGIEPSKSHALIFKGTVDTTAGAFINLDTGARGRKC